MDGMKVWYQSKTVWGGLIAVAASLLQVTGIQLGADVQADLAELAVTLAGLPAGFSRSTVVSRPRPESGENSPMKESITDHSFAIQPPLAT